MASPCMGPDWIGLRWRSHLLTMERKRDPATATCLLWLSRSEQWWMHFTRRPCNLADRMRARQAFAVKRARKLFMPLISGIRMAISFVPIEWVRHSHTGDRQAPLE